MLGDEHTWLLGKVLGAFPVSELFLAVAEVISEAGREKSWVFGWNDLAQSST